jgi:hypothetical protein
VCLVQKLAHLLGRRRLARAWIAQKQQMPNAGIAGLPGNQKAFDSFELSP